MQRVFGDLDALRYVDGRLDEERKAAFASHLADHPDEADRVALWARQNDVIRAAFANVALEPVPVALRLGPVPVGSRNAASGVTEARRPSATLHPLPTAQAGKSRPATATATSPIVQLQGRPRERSGRAARPRTIVTAIGLLVVAALVIFVAQSLMQRPVQREEPVATLSDETAQRVTRAADAFGTYALDPLRPVELTAAQGGTLSAWIRRRVGLPLEPADLSPQGWTLLGGRVVPGLAGPAAMFVYENAGTDRLSVFVERASSGVPSSLAFRRASEDSVAMAWSDGTYAYVVTVRHSLDWLSRNGMALKDRIERVTG